MLLAARAIYNISIYSSFFIDILAHKDEPGFEPPIIWCRLNNYYFSGHASSSNILSISSWFAKLKTVAASSLKYFATTCSARFLKFPILFLAFIISLSISLMMPRIISSSSVSVGLLANISLWLFINPDTTNAGKLNIHSNNNGRPWACRTRWSLTSALVLIFAWYLNYSMLPMII